MVAPLEQQRRNLSPAEAEELAIYPEGSIGYAFRQYRRTPGAWSEKASATHENWVHKQAGPREAHRALKIWRALWKVMAAFRLCGRDEDPSATSCPRAEARYSPKARGFDF
jgi:hypothetical protein